MSLDVYAGTLTRYYTNDWESAAQRQARLDGLIYQQITGDAPGETPLAADVSTAVRAWCEALTTGLGTKLTEPIQWSEEHDLPYFTDQLGWPGYTGLLLWAAYAHRADLERPTELPEAWEQDPAFLASLPKESGTPYRQILQPSLWLPSRFDFAFKAPDLAGTETWIGSTYALHRQLELLSEQTFRASPGELEASVAGAPPGPDEVEYAAKCTLARLYTLSRSACEHRLPMTLSF